MTTVRHSRTPRTVPFLFIAAVLCPFPYGKVICVDDAAAGANASRHGRSQQDTADKCLMHVTQGCWTSAGWRACQVITTMERVRK